MQKIFKVIGAILLCEAVGGLGAIATTPNISTWYATLNKPVFSPPSWLFGPAWTLLYALMGIALFLIWESKAKNKTTAYMYFYIQLFLNLLWSFIFFYFKLPLSAFIEIVALWGFILATIAVFTRISKPAGWLLVPYVLWVTFASTLNFAVWWLNR